MPKPKPSRSYNALHFEDLSPQRFEDLTRSLIYDFRNWASIEAVGRVGSDHGVDIRAIERVAPAVIQDDEADDYQDHAYEVREWVFQCKRYKRLGPKQVAEIAASDLGRQAVSPYGYVLVATCDFSHAAREAFRQKMVEHGITEFYLWGKGELEDKLYQPKNDHLLFAHFGISLQTTRRSNVSQLKASLALKRKLINVLGGLREPGYEPVLIRDPNDASYPDISSAPDNPGDLSWNYWLFAHHAVRDGLYFQVGRAMAYVDWETGSWDYIEDDLRREGAVQYLWEVQHGQAPSDWQQRTNYYPYWSSHVPDANKAHLVILGRLPYERILAVDEIGDVRNEGPHLLVEYVQGKDLAARTFGPELYWSLQAAGRYDNRAIAPNDEKRVAYFPKPITEEDLNS